MSGNNSTSNDLPSYIKNGDYEQQQAYHELLNTLLRQWLSSNGFQIPTLTSTEITALLALGVQPAGTLIYNSTSDVLQFIGATGAVQTINSSY
jgi:hypothetical protein